MKSVRHDLASKPKTLLDGHPCIDVFNWKVEEVYDALIARDYIGGCKSALWPGDGEHFCKKGLVSLASPEQEAKCRKELGWK